LGYHCTCKFTKRLKMVINAEILIAPSPGPPPDCWSAMAHDLVHSALR